MAKVYPQEFKDDVVRVARKGEAPLRQIAQDFGIGHSTLHKWLAKEDAKDGSVKHGENVDDVELRETKKRVRLLEQENEVLRRAAIYLGKDVLPK